MTADQFVHTGSYISGTGYGVAMLKTESEPRQYAVRLSYHGNTAIQTAEDYNHAANLMRAFCRVCHAWNTVQRIEAWLSASPNNAVIGY